MKVEAIYNVTSTTVSYIILRTDNGMEACLCPWQSLLKSLCYVCWYAINNSKCGATGVIFNRSQFLEFEKFISWDREKICISSL